MTLSNMEVLNKMIPFRKKRGLSAAKSHDDIYRKSYFGKLVANGNRNAMTKSHERLVTKSGRSTIGNDASWPFKPVKTVVNNNQVDRLQYLGSRLCNYKNDDSGSGCQPGSQRNGYCGNGVLNNRTRTPGNSASDAGREKRRFVIISRGATLGMYLRSVQCSRDGIVQRPFLQSLH